MLPDYYAILGIHPSASFDEVKQAFRSLARQYHPDMQPGSAAASATEQFRAIYDAYHVLASPASRASYDQQWAQQRNQIARATPGTWDAHPTVSPQGGQAAPIANLDLACYLSHNQVPIYPQEQLIYALSELTPLLDGQAPDMLPINLCIAIDRSSSMGGDKLLAVKKALRAHIEQLRPSDILSIVAFDNRPEVIARAEPKQLREVLIAAVDRLNERGGTEIAKALEAALEETRRFSRQAMVSHIILLTDGKTYGDEERCLELAFQARQQGIAITALGIGTQWNDHLLDQIADLSEGMSDYLAGADDIAAALDMRVRALRNTLATNVHISLELEGGVRLRRVTRVAPDIAELMDAAPADQRWMLAREAEMNVGIISASRQGMALALLWELMLPANVSGRYILGQINTRYDIPYANLTGLRKSGQLVVEFVEASMLTSASVSQHVKQVIEYVTAYRIQSRAQEIAEQGDHETASALMHTAALRLRDAAQEDLANQAQEHAEQLAQKQAPPRASLLKLKYSTKNLYSYQRS